jgi:hypothetical protein
MSDGIGQETRVLRTYLELPKPGQRGRKHREAGARERVGEGYESRVILLLDHDARDQDKPRTRRAIAREIEIACALASSDGIGHRLAGRHRGDLFPARRPCPGRDVTQDQWRLLAL